MLLQILMATYNGDKYIKTQLDSLLSQSFSEFEILVRDDGSTDNTLKILQEYKNKYPQKINILENSNNSGSAKNNFFLLMQQANADYIMFCDQDDFWLADKVEKTLAKMKEIEKNEKDIPVLVHTDLSVADENLNVTSPSFLKLSHIKNITALNRAVVKNCVTGCCLMINKALLKLVGESDENIIMHDWWLYLIASAFGKIGFINESTILYRQHENNEVGLKGIKFRKTADLRGALTKTYNQAEFFFKTFEDKLNENQKLLLTEYANIKNYSKIKKIRTIFKYRFFKHSLKAKFIQLIIC